MQRTVVGHGTSIDSSIPFGQQIVLLLSGTKSEVDTITRWFGFIKMVIRQEGLGKCLLHVTTAKKHYHGRA